MRQEDKTFVRFRFIDPPGKEINDLRLAAIAAAIATLELQIPLTFTIINLYKTQIVKAVTRKMFLIPV